MPSKNKKSVKQPKLVKVMFRVDISFIVDAKEYNNPQIQSPIDATNLGIAMVKGLADFPKSFIIKSEEVV